VRGSPPYWHADQGRIQHQDRAIGSARDEVVDTWPYVLLVAFHLVTAGICIAKGKLATGVVVPNQPEAGPH